jgi:hypothetical protein
VNKLNHEGNWSTGVPNLKTAIQSCKRQSRNRQSTSPKTDLYEPIVLRSLPTARLTGSGYICGGTPNLQRMDESFIIYVLHKDQELGFPARLLAYGYSYKIEVDIKDTKVFFEPDEERNWRALISYEELERNKHIDKELLKTLAEAIENITK